VPPWIKVIANPVSGSGKAARLARDVVYRLHQRGCRIDFLETRRGGDARRFAADVRGYSAVACVGGDGTVNEVLNGLPERDAPPLAFIPGGTANVLSKELGLPWTVDGLADVVVDGLVVRLDAGVNRRDGRKFLLFAGAGFDSFVCEEFHRRRKGPIHMAQYLFWGVKTIPFFVPPSLTVEVDGTIVDRDAAWVEVCNVAQYGGPLLFSDRAYPDDGLFEIMIQKGRRKRDTGRIFFAALVSYLTRIRYRMRDVVFLKGSRVRVWSSDGRRVPLQIDGDPAGELPAELEVLPRAIRILVPQRSGLARSRARRLRDGARDPGAAE